MPERMFSRLYHAWWYIVATIVLVTAVTITLIRLGLPHIDDYRADIENWVSQHSGYTIKSEKIDASWQGWTPYLNLHEITVMDNSGSNVLVKLHSVSLSIKPLAALLRQELSPLKITINGPRLVVIRDTDGSFNFAETSTKEILGQKKSETGFFADWLLHQRNITIEDATIEYTDLNKQDLSMTLSNVRLNFKKSSGRMQVELFTSLPENFGQSMSLFIDTVGDITTPQWSGELYLEGNNIYPARLLSLGQNDVSSFQFESAPSNIKFWSHWKKGHLYKIEGTLDASDVELAYNESSIKIMQLESSFSGIRNNNSGLDVSCNIAHLATENGIWPGTRIDFSSQKNAQDGVSRYIVRMDYLKIDDFAQFITPLLNSDKPYKLHGVLNNNLFVYQPGAEKPLSVSSDINFLTVDLDDNSTIRQVGGHIEGNTEYGLLKMTSSSLELTLPGIFRNNLALYELSGDISWNKVENKLVFHTSHLDTHTTDFNLLVKGNVIFEQPGNLPVTDLIINASDMNLEKITGYLPLDKHQKLREWMQYALVAGDVPSIDIVLRGPLENFPFDKQEGQFKLIAKIENATFDFYHEWIPIDQLDADLEIDNARLEVNAKNGYMYKTKLVSVNAVIDDLRTEDHIIRVKGTAQGTTDDAIFIIDNTPLSHSETLSEVKNHKFNGALSLDLALNIPLNHQPVEVNGNLLLDNVTLGSPELGIDLQNINGNVLFTRDTVSTEKLIADYFEQQVDVNIKTDEEARLVLSLSGDSGVDFITNQLVYFFPKFETLSRNVATHLTGSCHWIAMIAPGPNYIAGTENQEKLLTIESTLSGLTADMPAPLEKSYEPTKLEIKTRIFNHGNKEIDFVYGNQVTGNLVLKQDVTPALVRVEVALGENEELSRSGTGINIHGNINYLSVSKWHDFIDSFATNKDNNPDNEINIDVHANTLNYHARNFENTAFKVVRANPGLKISLNGNDIEGDINVPGDNSQEKITAKFKKLYLIDQNNDNIEKTGIDPRTISSIDLTVDEFAYNAFKLGKLDLSTSSTTDGLDIDSFSFTKPDMTITGNGTWKIVDNREFSKFTFNLNANQLDTMLSTFDYSVAEVKNGNTNMKLDATWSGSPMDFSLAAVNGSMTMDIGEGEFLNFEPKAGRLFGLLNLQSLIRFVSLDFSVFFKKSYVFDEITGNFSIEDGNAYTNNLAVKGNVADINLTGRTGLIDKDYDQIATVTPRTLFGPLSLGVNAVKFIAGDKIFKPIEDQFDKLIRNQYIIKGSWDNPVVEKYKGENENVSEGSG